MDTIDVHLSQKREKENNERFISSTGVITGANRRTTPAAPAPDAKKTKQPKPKKKSEGDPAAPAPEYRKDPKKEKGGKGAGKDNQNPKGGKGGNNNGKTMPKKRKHFGFVCTTMLTFVTRSSLTVGMPKTQKIASSNTNGAAKRNGKNARSAEHAVLLQPLKAEETIENPGARAQRVERANPREEDVTDHLPKDVPPHKARMTREILKTGGTFTGRTRTGRNPYISVKIS